MISSLKHSNSKQSISFGVARGALFNFLRNCTSTDSNNSNSAFVIQYQVSVLLLTNKLFLLAIKFCLNKGFLKFALLVNLIFTEYCQEVITLLRIQGIRKDTEQKKQFYVWFVLPISMGIESCPSPKNYVIYISHIIL